MIRNRFLRALFLFTLATSVLLPTGEILGIFPRYRQQLVATTVEEATRVARHLSRDLATPEGELDTAVLDQLAADAHRIQREFRLTRLKVFAADGAVAYSTAVEDLGTVNRKPYFRERVARGEVVAHTVHRHQPNLEGQIQELDVVEVYVPVLSGYRFAGAVELYYDVSEPTAQLNRLTRLSATATIAVSLAFLAVVFFSLRSLDRNLTARRETREKLRRSRGDLKELSARLLSTQEDERSKISRDLHDGLGQQLAALRFRLQSQTTELSQSCGAAARQHLQPIQELLGEAVEEVRRVCTDLRPPTLDQLGLVDTSQWFVARFRESYPELELYLAVSVSEEQVPERLKIHLFRILQEALHNVATHSQARLARVRLGRRGDRLALEITDDGVGYAPDPDPHRRGMGVEGMRERAEMTGGSLEIGPARPDGRGTRVLAAWPYVAP